MKTKTRRPVVRVIQHCEFIQVDKLFRKWRDSDTSMDFSSYWNKHVKNPECRFYAEIGLAEWRFYFNSEQDKCAWLLGANLNDS